MVKGRVLLMGVFVGTIVMLTGGYAHVPTSGGGSAGRLSAGTLAVSPMHDVQQEIAKLQSEKQVRDALKDCEMRLKSEPENLAVLLETAYLQYRLGWLFLSNQEKKDCYFKFFDYAKRAWKLDPDDYQASLLLAVAKAKIVGYLPHADQVRIARELARDVDELVRLRGDDPDVIYLLSWLNFEIGRISSFKRMMAAILFGGLPEGLSVDNAFDLIQKAIRARPDYAVYQYDLGYYYLRTGAKDKARQQFEHVLTLRPETVEARVYQQRAAGKIRELTENVN